LRFTYGLHCLIEYGDNIEKLNILQQTPFFYAMIQDNIDACRTLIEAHCNLNCQYHEQIPIEYAIDYGHNDVVTIYYSFLILYFKKKNPTRATRIKRRFFL
jgi:ankyrin repeat protein